MFMRCKIGNLVLKEDLNELLMRTITLTGNLQKTVCGQEEPGSIMGAIFDVPTSKQIYGGT